MFYSEDPGIRRGFRVWNDNQKMRREKNCVVKEAAGQTAGGFRLNGCQNYLECGERDQRFVLVSARVAFPKMPHAVLIQIFRPFRHEDGLTALGTGI
jgi:hypothetical protein